MSLPICKSFKHNVTTEIIDKQTIWKRAWHRYQDKTKVKVPWQLEYYIWRNYQGKTIYYYYIWYHKYFRAQTYRFGPDIGIGISKRASNDSVTPQCICF